MTAAQCTARRRQCAKCPWKKNANPTKIKNYKRGLHEALREKTIAEPGSMRGAPAMMACHESKMGSEYACVGWLANQLGPGNNLPLRLKVMMGAVDANFELVGEQHETFEDTLPKRRSNGRR